MKQKILKKQNPKSIKKHYLGAFSFVKLTYIPKLALLVTVTAILYSQYNLPRYFTLNFNDENPKEEREIITKIIRKTCPKHNCNNHTIGKQILSKLPYKKITVVNFNQRFHFQINNFKPEFCLNKKCQRLISEEGIIYKNSKARSTPELPHTRGIHVGTDRKNILPAIQLKKTMDKEFVVKQVVFEEHYGYYAKILNPNSEKNMIDVFFGFPPFASKKNRISQILDFHKKDLFQSIDLTLKKRAIVKTLPNPNAVNASKKLL